MRSPGRCSVRLFHRFDRFQHRAKQRLDRIARTDHPGSNPIDTRVKKVESDMRLRKQIVPNELSGDVHQLIVHRDYMIAVPTNRPADVEQDTVRKQSNR